jgi:purine-binding chemotaxis protein CheW
VTDILMFKLGQQCYGIPIAQVAEVIQMVSVTHMPELPAAQVGFINYRGEMIPLIDLREMFQTSVLPVHVNTTLIIVRHQQMVALLADTVEDFLSLATEIEAVQHPYISGVLRNHHTIIQLLDVTTITATF